MAAAEPLRVQVVYGPQGAAVAVVNLQLHEGATAAAALQASGLLERFGLQLQALRMGVWGRVCEPARLLRDHDRVEVYRPLLVDPKEARRQRYQRAGGKPRGKVSGSRK